MPYANFACSWTGGFLHINLMSGHWILTLLGLVSGVYKKRNEMKTLTELCTNLAYSWTGFLRNNLISERQILMLLRLVVDAHEKA